MSETKTLKQIFLESCISYYRTAFAKDIFNRQEHNILYLITDGGELLDAVHSTDYISLVKEVARQCFNEDGSFKDEYHYDALQIIPTTAVFRLDIRYQQQIAEQDEIDRKAKIPNSKKRWRIPKGKYIQEWKELSEFNLINTTQA